MKQKVDFNLSYSADTIYLKCIFCIVVTIYLSTPPVYAQDSSAQDTNQILTFAGTGAMDGVDYQHAGLRLLLNASDSKKYGVELASIHTVQGDYVSTGFVLEARSRWVNSSIESIGYFGQGSVVQNQPGVVASIGWEPGSSTVFKPYVEFRHKVIFASNSMTDKSLSAGLSVGF